MPPRLRFAALATIATCSLLVDDPSVHAATVTAAYEAGHRDVTINGYGTDGLGVFALDTGTGVERAWCTEAHVAHTRRTDAYAEVPSTMAAPELDALIWSLSRTPAIDDDTATAAAALVWFYSGARRSIGPTVWSDGSRGFAPISPTTPQPWDTLPRFSMQHPIGLRAGGTDLDAAERRVAELHRWASAHRGPWELTAGASPGTFVVHGPGGPIADAAVRVTLRRPGHDDVVSEVSTGSDGVATVDLPRSDDGATLIARVESPGAHRAWDAPGDVQRLVTATTRALTVETVVPPSPRHVEVRKSSSDPTLSVAGATFELRDAEGTPVGGGRTDDDGRLRFAPIDPVRHPAPYTLVETAAPPGLSPAAPVTIGAVSTDPDRPTIVIVVNHPVLVPVRVRKELSLPGIGPSDRSGFGFSIIRLADGAEHTASTGPDGSTEAVEVAVGEYEICERTVPPWATTLVDGGCRRVAIGADDAGTVVEVTYVNGVPTPTIDTRAADAVDGDQVVAGDGATAIDRIRLDGLVPGTSYELTGELLTRSGGVTGVTSTMQLVADAPSVDVELRFELPPLPPGGYVIVERLAVGGVVVATHDALDDRDQQLEVAPAPTSTTAMPTSTTPSTTTSPSTTSPSATSPSTTTVASPLPEPPTPPTPSTLPRTGADVAARALRLADVTFVAGVGLSVLAALAPRRRPDARTAGRRSAPPFGG